LHEHGQAGFEQACVYRFVEHEATRPHLAVPIFIMGGVFVNLRGCIRLSPELTREPSFNVSAFVI
jgi:hypothetical protein